MNGTDASMTVVFLIVDKFLIKKREEFKQGLSQAEAKIFQLLMGVPVSSFTGMCIQAVLTNPTRQAFRHVVGELAHQAKFNRRQITRNVGRPLVKMLEEGSEYKFN